MKAITRAPLLAMLATLVVTMGAQAAGPTEQLRAGVDPVFRTLGDPALQGADMVRERRARVFALIDDVFDFGHTARLSLGPHWERLTPEQRAGFVETFRAFVHRVYSPNVDGLDGEQIVYTGETVDGDRATVKSKVITKTGSQIPVDFRLAHDGGRWRIYDVNVEGLSLVGNYRTQFGRILRAGSYDELLQRLQGRPQ